MLRYENGTIQTKDKVIDIENFEIRPKIKEENLQGYYNSFIFQVRGIKEYFKNQNSFEKAFEEVSNTKRPKLIARETNKPSLLSVLINPKRHSLASIYSSNRRVDKEYFIAGRCLVNIPSPSVESPKNISNNLLRKDITEIFKEHPGYECIIEIPNDTNVNKSRATTFHESLHYLIARYQLDSGRTFVSTLVKKEDIAIHNVDEMNMERLINERAVEILTDKLLTNYSKSQFEERWDHYCLNDNFYKYVGTISSISTGSLIGCGFLHPYILPLALVPGRIRDYFIKKNKESKRKELMAPREYPKFEI